MVLQTMALPLGDLAVLFVLAARQHEERWQLSRILHGCQRGILSALSGKNLFGFRLNRERVAVCFFANFNIGIEGS
jgi:hypothetical protein